MAKRMYLSIDSSAASERMLVITCYMISCYCLLYIHAS